MPVSKFERYLPWAGVLSGVLFAVSGYLSAMSDDTSDPAKAIQTINDGATQSVIAMVAGALCSVTLLFFAAAVRSRLRSGETGEASYSSIAYAGTIAVGLAVSLNAWLTMAALDAADEANEAAVGTLTFLGATAWMPWVAASAVMFLGVGLGGLRTAVLPKWLSIVSVVLGVLCLLGPTGIAVWFATPVWFVVTGLVMTARTGDVVAREENLVSA